MFTLLKTPLRAFSKTPITHQQNALWVKVLGGRKALDLDEKPDALKAVFPDYTEIQRQKSTMGNYTGNVKLYFENDETARKYWEQRMELKFTGMHNDRDNDVIVDIVGDQKMLWLNTVKGVTAEMISNDEFLSQNLEEIKVQKENAQNAHFSLIYKDYKSADAIFEGKVNTSVKDGNSKKIGDFAYVLKYPGVRANPLGRVRGPNQRRQKTN